MPKIAYVKKNFSGSSKLMISHANSIIEEYQRQGFKLTLRQLFYQFVSRDLIPNTTKSYKNLGSIINDGRLAGEIDWLAIEDRTRHVHRQPHWDSPADIVEAAAQSFRIDKWVGQKYRPEVFIEKEALAGVMEGICDELDIPFLSCRGYVSQSEMWSSAMRLKHMAEEQNQTPIILHFGDHDPSGIDMTRDITERIDMFMGGVELRRLALNMNQVEEYNPPPNPAKITDSRFAEYERKFGDQSWELDALEPKLLVELVRKEVESLRDDDLYQEREDEEASGKKDLKFASEKWKDVASFLKKKQAKGKK
jgi:hypothetical protein